MFDLPLEGSCACMPPVDDDASCHVQ